MDRNDLKIVTVPLLDTGLGREAGYEDDKALVAAAQKQREALPPAVRDVLEAADAELERRLLFGDGSS